MKKNTLLRAALGILLILALMVAGTYGVNGFTAPIVAENERLAAEAAAAAEKELLGDSVMLYDAENPADSVLTVTADTVRSVYRDETKQNYLLRLSTSEGYSKQPIELTLTIDFSGTIVSLEVDEDPDDKDLGEAFPQSFAGEDSTLSGVELVAGVTFTSSAIRSAVNDGFDTLIDNGLFAAAEKSDEQLLSELIAVVYPGIVNKAGVVQGEELEGSGSLSGGFKAANGSGCAWFVDGEEKLLAVSTVLGGVRLYNAAGEDVTAAADAALVEQIAAATAAATEEGGEKDVKALSRLFEDEAEFTAAEIPGLSSTVTAAYTVRSGDETYYAFVARPYGYSNEPMELYFILDGSGAIKSFRAKELILYSEYFTNYQLDEPAYREGFAGLTADGYNGEQALISGATMSTEAVDVAVRDVFEAFGLLMGTRG